MSTIELTAECTTEETGGDGVRHNCVSQWDSVTAPDGHVIDHNNVTAKWLSDAGSENSYDLVFENWVEVIPDTDLKFPSTMKLRVKARGPKGHWSGRGWSKVKIIAPIKKYK